MTTSRDSVRLRGRADGLFGLLLSMRMRDIASAFRMMSTRSDQAQLSLFACNAPLIERTVRMLAATSRPGLPKPPQVRQITMPGAEEQARMGEIAR